MDEGRSTGPLARALAWLLSCTTAIATLPGCGQPHDAIEPELVELAEIDETAAIAAAQPGDPPTRPQGGIDRFAERGLLPPPALPDPTLFGAGDPSTWQIDTLERVVPASNANAIDPRVRTIEVEVEVRPSLLPDRWVDYAMTLTAVREEGGAALARIDFDSSDAGTMRGDGSRALVDAMLADVAVAPASCSDTFTTPGLGDAPRGAGDALTDASDPQAGGGMWAGGAMWWARMLCPTQRDAYIIANLAALFALSLFDADLGAGIATCEALPIPAEAQACSAAAADAQTTIAIVAIPSVQNAAQFATLGYVLSDQIRNMAAAVGLGGPAGPQWWPIFAAANALTVVSVGQAALGMAVRANGAVLAAIAVIAPFPQLEPQALFGFNTVYPRMLQHQERLHFLVLCLANVARWIAVAGLIGFIALVVIAALNAEPEPLDALASRASPTTYDPLVGPPALTGRRPVMLDGEEVILEGPLLPRANHYASAFPLAFDIAALAPSYVQAATLGEWQGRTSRSIQFGYADPELALTEDVWGIDALTGLPTLLASAGTPVVLDGTYLPANAVPELVVEFGAVHARGAWLDLAGQETDAAGNPIFLPWVCVGTEHTCPLGFDTTGSPEQIAAHETVTRYWKITATTSIVDVESGEPIEDAAGYRVSITAPRERPTDPCYADFDYDEWRWVYDVMLPGCGPHGIDPGDSGGPGDGGGPDDGGGLPPPPAP